MLVLTLRTDKPESEIGLYQDGTELVYEAWQAHRQLAETIHYKLQEILKSQNKNWGEIEALVVYQGPGSFTGLRIGISVANALASSYGIPIVGETGEQWQQSGIAQLVNGKNDAFAVPEYGADVHITRQKK